MVKCKLFVFITILKLNNIRPEKVLITFFNDSIIYETLKILSVFNYYRNR